ncbi:MAG: hypothetical protein RR458_01115 [Clostridia bacterium]
MESAKMLEETLNKKVSVWTLNSNFTGTVVAVDGDWIKILANSKKKMEFILKTDMITSITVME